MNAHRVIVLGVVAVVALGAALWSSQTRRPSQEEGTGVAAPVVPGLDAKLNDVSEIRIRTAGDVLQATLVRGDAGWTLAQRDGWPVDVAKLREYLIKLARAKRIEAKTDNPALHFKLGVEEIATPDTPGVQLEIDGLAAPVKLLVGRTVPRGDASYVRMVGEAQSWQADADLTVEKTAANWLQRDVMDVASGRIERVAITPAGDSRFEIVDAPDGAPGDFELASIPKGREAASDFVADAAAGFLAALRFDDVLKASDAPAPAEGLTRASFVTEDGLTIDATLWAAGDKQHAQFAVAIDEAKAQSFAVEAQAKAKRENDASTQAQAETTSDGVSEATPPASTTDSAKDVADRVATLRGEADALRLRVDDRTFVLPSFKTANVTKRFEDYLKPKE